MTTEPTTRKRVRPVQFVIQPMLVADDGESLAPLQVEPITVTAADWDSFAEAGLSIALQQLEDSINTPAEDADTPAGDQPE